MSKPVLTTTIGGYKLYWEADQVTIEVTRVKESKVHCQGEIMISHATGHLKQCVFSFTNHETRRSVAKELAKLLPIDWDSIMEQLCVFVLREIRKGEPVFALGEGPASRPEWLCDPFILANQPSVLFGAPSGGKSTFGLILAAMCSLGGSSNGYRFFTPEKSQRILYLDWETDKGVIEWQLQCIRNGLGIEFQLPIFYRRCSVPLANDIEQINAVATEYNVDAIWLDSLGLAAGGDLNTPEAALSFFSALRTLNKTPFILAHTARGQENNDKHVFGSVFFEATARNIWEIVKTQDDDNSVIVGLYHKKPPPFGKLHNPMGYRIEFSEDSTTFDYHDPKSIDELLSRMGNNTKILELLKRGALAPKEIQEQLGIPEGTCRSALKRLKEKGSVMQLGEKYVLPAR
jgi:hypothetical protein